MKIKTQIVKVHNNRKKVRPTLLQEIKNKKNLNNLKKEGKRVQRITKRTTIQRSD